MASENDFRAGGQTEPSGRTAGVWIALASLLSVAFMAHHPTYGGKGLAEFVDRVQRGAVTNEVVHGALVALSGVLCCGFTFLASRLGMSSFAVRAGLVAYGTGFAAMAAAASASGFVVPQLVIHYNSPTPADLEAMRHLLGLVHAANQVCSRLGVVALSLAVVLWSASLVGRPGLPRAVGILGFVAGGLPVVALLSGHLRMNVHGVLAFLLAQTVWNLAVAALLIRNRL
jgi:hypothetical protein